MNQPDSVNNQDTLDAAINQESIAEILEVQERQPREWFPEDEDEWYEPDYSRKRS